MAVAQVSTALFISSRNARVFSSNQCPATDRLPQTSIASSGSWASFAIGTPLVIQRYHRRGFACKARPVSVRSEQSTQQGKSLDVWLGRLAMVGFAVAITVEISTGKGLLENFGLISPLPTAALAVTALVGILTAVFIFQSASKN